MKPVIHVNREIHVTAMTHMLYKHLKLQDLRFRGGLSLTHWTETILQWCKLNYCSE